ncbi:tetratricopeptide repeat (TPR)-like superfamily protein [Actinidia rufa]|uniref:Tetratricopeptide repeat (TPR)-like superfamily protein n=1 Tax=Actinidia rufa TaxID=165716 RepID=A0A7J0GI75_9ERIC|nr:tetratricopeptide repeat (TPR)-like superfamily protein [Actinidia rufa]
MESVLRSVQTQIVNALRLGERNRASSLLSDIARRNNSLTANDFVYILEYCARSPDPLFVMETWRVMGEKDVYVDDKCYLLIVRALCKGGYIEEAFSVMDMLGENHDLLRDLEAACEALQHMVALVLRGGFIISKTGEGKLFTLRLDIPMPSSCELGLKRCSDENEDSELSVSSKVGNEIENDGLRMLRKDNSSSIMKVLRWSFNDVIHACAQATNCSLAEQLILQMQSLGLEPSCSTYDGFIKAVVSERGFQDAIEVIKIMQQKHLKPYASTLATIAIGCSKGLELDITEAFLNQISRSSSVRPYNAFLEACDTLDRPERAVCILVKIKEMELQPDIRTYELLFSLFGNVNAPYEEGNMLSQVDVTKRINVIEMDMVKNGIQHSHLSMKNLLKALGAEGMVRELIQYLRVAENQFSRGYSCLGTPSYNTVLQSLLEAKEIHMATEIFKSMKSCGFLPNAATYNIMIDCCSIIRCFKSASALVSLMVRDGFYPRAVTYTALMKIWDSGVSVDGKVVKIGIVPWIVLGAFRIGSRIILLANDEFDEALNLLDQGILEGIQSDVLLFNTFLQEACDKGRIDIIELIVKRMHEQRVQPDPSTCYFVFSAYADHDYISTAMEALQVLSLRMISEESSILEESRTEFEENYILAEDSEAESRIVELFKDSEENLAVALLNLRWCATLGFQISWLPNQSPWAKRLSSKYGPGESVAA